MAQSQIEPVLTAHLERPPKAPAILTGVVAGAVTMGLALIGTLVLTILGIFSILAGIIFTLTGIGAIVGLPLIVLGLVAVAGGVAGGSAAIVFALVLGVGIGYVVYRRRMKRLSP